MKVRDFLRHWSVGSNENYPTFRLLTLVLSSIEEEKRRSPQATLNTHPGEGITSLYENISVRFSFSVRLVNERCRSAVDVPWQRPRTPGTYQGVAPREFHRLKWKFPTGARVVGSRVMQDKVIYFGSDDGN